MVVAIWRVFLRTGKKWNNNRTQSKAISPVCTSQCQHQTMAAAPARNISHTARTTTPGGGQTIVWVWEGAARLNGIKGAENWRNVQICVWFWEKPSGVKQITRGELQQPQHKQCKNTKECKLHVNFNFFRTSSERFWKRSTLPGWLVVYILRHNFLCKYGSYFEQSFAFFLRSENVKMIRTVLCTNSQKIQKGQKITQEKKEAQTFTLTGSIAQNAHFHSMIQ